MKRAMVFNVGPGPDEIRMEGGRLVGQAYGGWSVKAWYQRLSQMIERNADVPRDVKVVALIEYPWP